MAQEKNKLNKDIRPDSQASNSSCSTDESVTAFIERTVIREQHPDQALGQGLLVAAKVSECESQTVTLGQLPPTPNPEAEETQSEVSDHRALYSDTRDPGELELYDSSGVDLPTAKPRIFTLDPDVFPSFSDVPNWKRGKFFTKNEPI